MPVAHREITKKHIKRIAEKVAESGGGFPVDDDDGTIVAPLVTVDSDYKTVGYYTCAFASSLNDSELKNYWNEHLNNGESVLTFGLNFPTITSNFVFLNERIYIPMVRYYKNSAGVTDTLTIYTTTASDGTLDRIEADNWSWTPDILMNVSFVEYNPLSVSVNVNPPHLEYMRVRKLEGRPSGFGNFYYDETKKMFVQYNT